MKKLLLTALMLVAFGSSVFAQISFSSSAKNRATSGIFSSDSDNLGAKDIFDIERTFFTAGYMPSLTYGGSYTGDSATSIGTMTGFWAMPINDTITVGFSGEYKMNATKTDNVYETYAGATAGTGTGGAFVNYNGGDALYRTEYYTESSGFKLRASLKFGDNLAFHYAIARLGTDYQTVNTITTADDKEELVYNRSYTYDSPIWAHQIAAAYKTDAFKIYLPVGVVINMNNTTKITTTDSTSGTESTTSSYTTSEEVYLYIQPQFIMPFEKGAMTQFTAGLNMTFRPYYGSGNTITTDANGNVTENKYNDKGYVYLRPYFTPTFEWNTWQDKISFIVEPTVSLAFSYENDGYNEATATSSDYDNTVTPSLSANIGSTIRPVDWFEFRAGLKYGMNWENNITTTSYASDSAKSYSTSTYTFYSTFNVYTGFGFIVGEDFFIDIYAQAGNENSLALSTTVTSTSTSLIDINAYGIELSYRF